MIYRKIFKPIADRFFALVLILFFSPVLIVVAIVLRVKLGSPVFFTQKRPGKDARIFTIYKFRTMTNDRGAEGELLPDEARLIGAGKAARAMSLDELPQLFNVLKGEMSFIGPRPLLPEYLPLYNEFEARRHEVLPGITGWAQVNGRNDQSWEKRFELDVFYVDNLSFALDFKIALMTIAKVLARSDVNEKGSATKNPFMGSVKSL
ncbi:MAG: sugar transferase [Helicobacteraceae bacterium]|jgi:undecaprenyl phosphate N,N'-diacetylbacillosamine 1-phosphate transferase|nr:sugar transferase [Helicobacteraceae bacterium]